MTNRKRRTTVVEAPLSNQVIDGLLWAQEYGQSPVNPEIETAWKTERAESPTLLDLPVVG